MRERQAERKRLRDLWKNFVRSEEKEEDSYYKITLKSLDTGIWYHSWMNQDMSENWQYFHTKDEN